MKAVILAAGNGVRLKPVTETRPKPLVPVLCKPLLLWHLERLASVREIDEVVIVVGYMDTAIRTLVESYKHPFKVRFVKQEKPLGTGDAVIKGVEGLDHDEDVIIIYSDIYSSVNVIPEITRIEGSVLVAAEVSDPEKYGVIVEENGFLKTIVEKPLQPPSRLVNSGIYKLKVRDIVENSDIQPSPRGELEFTDIVNNMSRRGIRVRVVKLPESTWIDVGRPWHIIEANKMALKELKGRIIKGSIVEPVYITGDVYIGEGTVVKPFTIIEGPAYIDRNVELGPSARIRPWTVVCSGSKIGFSVEVKESVILENVKAKHLAYIGDSIICEEVNIAAGTIIANLRFDKATIKMRVENHIEDTGRVKMGAVIGARASIGVNVSISPGVKIGSGAWIMPGTVVYRDVESNTIYYGSGESRNKSRD